MFLMSSFNQITRSGFPFVEVVNVPDEDSLKERSPK